MGFNQVDEYNGWINKPTWLLYTWLSNDYDADGECRDMAEECWEWAEATEYQTRKDVAIRDMSKRIRAGVENDKLLEKADFYTDLLQWGIAYINFDAVAEAYIDAIYNEQK